MSAVAANAARAGLTPAAGALLSDHIEGAAVVDPSLRNSSSYTNGSRPFLLKDTTHERQFSHMYTERLRRVRGRVLAAAREKWPGCAVKERIIDVRVGDECVVVGTLYKDMKLKPCVLDEYMESSIMKGPKPELESYVADDDSLVIEDTTGRVPIAAEGSLATASMVSGIVVAVRAKMTAAGKMSVQDHCFAAARRVDSDPGSAAATSGPAGKLLLVSGLNVRTGFDGLRLQLLADYVAGHLGTASEQADEAASICRVIIAGNTLAGVEATAETKDPTDTKVASSSHRKDHGLNEAIAAPVRVADDFLSQFARSVPVDLMPGPSDPSNHALPQQPLHDCLFPKSRGFRTTFQGVPNPYQCTIGETSVLGHSGQPIADIARFSSLTDPLDVLEATLRWQHIAPTAPDTLACYPFFKRDPFIISNTPHLMFSGNADSFATRVAQLEGGLTVRIVSVPDFSKTGVAVLVDLATHECTPLHVGVDSSLCAEDAPAEPMDVDADGPAEP